MPSLPPRRCNYPGCKKKITGRTSYCPEHDKLLKQQYEKTRETAVQRGYTNRWRKIRNTKLQTNPLCERCSKIAVLVHHKDHNSKKNEWPNLESLCNKCHEKEHGKDRFRKRT